MRPKPSSPAAAIEFAILFVPTAIAPPDFPQKTLAGAEGFEPPSSVLETDSLTVELTPLCSCSADALVRVPLFNLFMRRMLPAPAAELFQFNPVRRRFAVLRSRIVPLFAITALHCNDLSGHENSS